MMGAVFWPVVAVGAFLIWIVVAFVGLPDRPRMPLIRVWRPRHPRMFMLAFAIAALGFGVRYLFPQPANIENWLLSFLVDLAPEMVGMAFTVVVIDELNQQLAERQEKERIIRQMASLSNEFALDAFKIAKDEGWIQDGSIVGRSLLRANLEELRLQDANLDKVKLVNAKLRNAKFGSVSLREARLNLADLANATLFDVNLTGADLGWANLQQARLINVNLTNAVLIETNLLGTNLSHTILNGANLIGAKYNNSTKWPQGFVPPPEARDYGEGQDTRMELLIF